VKLRSLAGKAMEEEEAAAEAHAAGCAACRWHASEMEAVWSALGSWEVAPAPEDAETGLLARFDAQERRPGMPVPRTRWTWPAVAAAALAGVLVGVVLPRPGAPLASSQPAVVDGSAFLLLLRRGPDATAPDSGPVFDRMVAEYSAWRAGLSEQGVLIGSNLLDSATGLELRGVRSGVTVTHGVPLDASGEYVSGYYLVAAPDLSSARELARTSPHLRYGGSIELRAVTVPPTPEAP
jgi:hypothetical protein